MLENEKIIFEDIVRNMSDGVVVIRFDGRISLCNQAAADALGCEISALSGSSIALRPQSSCCGSKPMRNRKRPCGIRKCTGRSAMRRH